MLKIINYAQNINNFEYLKHFAWPKIIISKF